MAMSRQITPRLKDLLNRVPPGFLVDTSWLKAQGTDSRSIQDYVSRDWLEGTIRGSTAVSLPVGLHGSSGASWEILLLSLQRIMEHDVHPGGEGALELAGHVHHLGLEQASRVHFYGSVPSWLKRFPSQTGIVVHRRTLFGDDRTGIVDADHGYENSEQTTPAWRWPVRASSPERAILEALDEMRKHAGFDKIDKIFETLATLRPKQMVQLQTLASTAWLASRRSVKVRRLFYSPSRTDTGTLGANTSIPRVSTSARRPTSPCEGRKGPPNLSDKRARFKCGTRDLWSWSKGRH